MPTEIQWEYGCRSDPGGTMGPIDYWWSVKGEDRRSSASRIDKHAWTRANSGGDVISFTTQSTKSWFDYETGQLISRDDAEEAHDSHQGRRLRTHQVDELDIPVGHGPHRNRFGLSDTLGHVWEWTSSVSRDRERVRYLRGGSMLLISDASRCSLRDGNRQSFASRDFGMRVCRR